MPPPRPPSCASAVESPELFSSSHVGELGRIGHDALDPARGRGFARTSPARAELQQSIASAGAGRGDARDRGARRVDTSDPRLGGSTCRRQDPDARRAGHGRPAEREARPRELREQSRGPHPQSDPRHARDARSDLRGLEKPAAVRRGPRARAPRAARASRRHGGLLRLPRLRPRASHHRDAESRGRSARRAFRYGGRSARPERLGHEQPGGGRRRGGHREERRPLRVPRRRTARCASSRRSTLASSRSRSSPAACASSSSRAMRGRLHREREDSGKPTAPTATTASSAGDGSRDPIVVLDITDRAAAARRPQIDSPDRSWPRAASAARSTRWSPTATRLTSRPTRPGPQIPTGCESGTNEAAVRARFARARARERAQGRARHLVPRDPREGRGEAALRGPPADGQRRRSGLHHRGLVRPARQRRAPVTATLQSRPGAVFASQSALYVSVVHGRRAAGGTGIRSTPGGRGERDPQVPHRREPARDALPGERRRPRARAQLSSPWTSGPATCASPPRGGACPIPGSRARSSILAPAEGGNLVRVGAVENIAPGEDIRAVRFDDDRGYVVTFKKTDPLFVVDLVPAGAPRPSSASSRSPASRRTCTASTRMHLLSIGFDADDHGSFAYFDGVILQLFDVTEPTEPKLVFTRRRSGRAGRARRRRPTTWRSTTSPTRGSSPSP